MAALTAMVALAGMSTAWGSSALGATSALFGASALWAATPVEAAALRIGQPAPEIAGGPWINSAPLTLQVLRGRVVLVEFWTYG